MRLDMRGLSKDSVTTDQGPLTIKRLFHRMFQSKMRIWIFCTISVGIYLTFLCVCVWYWGLNPGVLYQ